MAQGDMSEYRFDPATYVDLMRAEVPAYARLQQRVGEAAAGLPVTDVLDLGIGTGETLAAVLEVHPGARAVGLDKNEAMLGAAAERLAGVALELRTAELTDALPPGPFDLVVSALAIHHLEGPEKARLFARIAGVLRPGGCFVLGDVVIPVDPADAVTPLTSDHDRPSTLDDQLRWLADAGFDATPVWAERDLVVVRAHRADRGH
jgi:tRNA (cmo5U34)-methyltransferase